MEAIPAERVGKKRARQPSFYLLLTEHLSLPANVAHEFPALVERVLITRVLRLSVAVSDHGLLAAPALDPFTQGWYCHVPLNTRGPFGAEMPSSIKNIEGLTKELAVLGKDPAMSLIILFGSVARMETHRESDVDVAFLSDEPLDLLDLTMKVTRLLRTDHVDVVDLRRASPLLAMEVVRGGRIVYERAPGEYATFCSLAFRRYVDTAKLRVAQKQAIGNFLASRGLA